MEVKHKKQTVFNLSPDDVEEAIWMWIALQLDEQSANAAITDINVDQRTLVGAQVSLASLGGFTVRVEGICESVTNRCGVEIQAIMDDPVQYVATLERELMGYDNELRETLRQVHRILELGSFAAKPMFGHVVELMRLVEAIINDDDMPCSETLRKYHEELLAAAKAQRPKTEHPNEGSMQAYAAQSRADEDAQGSVEDSPEYKAAEEAFEKHAKLMEDHEAVRERVAPFVDAPYGELPGSEEE